MTRRATDPTEIPALEGVAGPERARRGRALRRVGVAILTGIVVLACLGLLGPREASTAATGSTGAEMVVEHPSITRGGADSEVRVELTGLPADGSAVTLAIDTAMLERLGIETISPAPDHETSDATSQSLTYDEPPSGELTVRLSGRIPTRPVPGWFTYDVRTSGAAPLTVTARTVVLP